MEHQRENPQTKVSEEWDSVADDWDNMAGSYRNNFYNEMFEFLDQDSVGDHIVVDFGCGTGLLTEKLCAIVSEVVCLDPAPKMIERLDAKILSNGWTNVRSYATALGAEGNVTDCTTEALDALVGRVDLIVASSVLSFVPSTDFPATMQALGRMLRKGGLFIHSDWPVSSKHMDGFSVKRADEVYAMAGLQAVSTEEIQWDLGEMGQTPVFFGVARKP